MPTSLPIRPAQDVEKVKDTSAHTPIHGYADPCEFVIDEEAIYEHVANEIESGNIWEGLWTKLWAETDGDDANTLLYPHNVFLNR